MKENDISEEVFVDNNAFIQHKNKKKTIRNIVIILAALFVTAYGVMVFLSYKYFAPGTRINGVDCAFKDKNEVVEKLDEKYKDYKLTLKFKNGESVIYPVNIDYKASFGEAVDSIKKKQNPFLWFIYIFSDDNEAEVHVEFDRDKLKKTLDDIPYLKEKNMIQPEEPKIIFNSGTQKAEIQDGDKGTLIDKDRAYKLCEERLNALDKTLDIYSTSCYIEPKFDENADQIKEAVEKVNSYISTKIKYDYGNTVVEVPAEEIFAMLTIDDIYDVQVSREKVYEYINALSRMYDTYGTDRVFRTHDGRKFVTNSETYGFLIDKDAEADALYTDIVNREDVEREPELDNWAYSLDNQGNDIGNSYVEVNLSQQKVYLYKEGQLIFECDCVSGCVAEGHTTPGGLFDIDAVIYDTVLEGEDYSSPVKFWMPFNGGIGFHDATWRSEFGGNIYVNNGSHGCVNLPYDYAQILYENVEWGFPVICYWESELSY